jgi:hypothetical protein
MVLFDMSNAVMVMKPTEVCLLQKNGRSAPGARRSGRAVCFWRSALVFLDWFL